jgi:hypothetical protein
VFGAAHGARRCAVFGAWCDVMGERGEASGAAVVGVQREVTGTRPGAKQGVESRSSGGLVGRVLLSEDALIRIAGFASRNAQQIGANH